MKKKTVALLLACVMALGVAVGGTLAWLTDKTTEVKNTFSTSDIGVELKETTTEYKMIPGWDITKNPKAWITEGSEAAYLFVKVEESANFDTFMTYKIADGWTLLDDTTTVGDKIDTDTNDTYVIYRAVTSTEQMGETNASAILKDDKVTVKDSVTKEMMTATDFTQPTLTFTAYAVQYKDSNNSNFTPEAAWKESAGYVAPDTSSEGTT